MQSWVRLGANPETANFDGLIEPFVAEGQTLQHSCPVLGMSGKILGNSAILGWAAEHFEGDSRNLAGMVLHSSVL